MITLLVDSDPMVYAAGFAVETNFYEVNHRTSGSHIKTFKGKADLNTWLKENDKKESDFQIEKRTEVEPLPNACQILKKQLQDLIKEFQAEEIHLFLTDDRRGYNFREYLALSRKYKDRPSNKRPVYYKELRQYLIDNWDAEVVTGFEADDMVAIQQWAALEDGSYETVIVTIDKDLQMVPGKHYHPDKKTISTVTSEQARHNFYMQLLTGDQVDTIPGLPGVGPKKAEKILEDCVTEEEYREAVLKEYVKKFKEAGPYVMVEQARLLFMLRQAGDIWLLDGENYLGDIK